MGNQRITRSFERKQDVPNRKEPGFMRRSIDQDREGEAENGRQSATKAGEVKGNPKRKR